jgi:hypothetical protein
MGQSFYSYWEGLTKVASLKSEQILAKSLHRRSESNSVDIHAPW